MANPQRQSVLSKLPVELRWAIYEHLSPESVHITRGPRGGLIMIECVAGDISLEADGQERCLTGDKSEDKHWFPILHEPQAVHELRRVGLPVHVRVRDEQLHGPIWPRRLQSAWGPHWMCEEHYQNGAGWTSIGALLLSCKWIDFTMFMAENLVVHVTDLAVLQNLCAVSRSGFASQIDDLTSLPARKVKNLALSLRLPLPVFEALDEGPESPPGEIKALSALWSEGWPEVSLMSDLRALRLEVDHTDLSSWSVVNERRLLRPIAELKEHNPQLSVTVVLPKLHPRYETPDRHFVAEDKDRPPFSITRRVRQKCHAWRDYKGTWLIKRSRYDTFPMIPFYISKFVVDFDPTDTGSGLPPEYAQFLEQGELERWKRGEDPTAWVLGTLSDWHMPLEPNGFSHPSNVL